MLLIDSVYINSGGGKVLLKTFINELIINNIRFHLLIDKRLYDNGFLKNFKLTFNFTIVKCNEFSRLLFYLKNANAFNSIFCFSSIPPTYFFKNTQVIIYFHNLYLTKSKKLNFINEIKKKYLFFLTQKNYKWIVQSKFVKSELLNYNFIHKENVLIYPFFQIHNKNPLVKDLSINKSINSIDKNNVVYTYLADSSIHKNHIFLLKCWFLFFDSLDHKNIELHLTVEFNPKNPELNSLIGSCDLLIKYNIVNHYTISNLEAFNLLNISNFLIFVSEFESFGLPLIEACQFGCKIIAPTKEYVFEVISPTLTFIPNSINSLFNVLLISYSNKDLKESEIIINNQLNSIIKYITYV